MIDFLENQIQANDKKVQNFDQDNAEISANSKVLNNTL